VPILVLDNGKVLTESFAILRYVCRLNDNQNLLGTDFDSSYEIEMYMDKVKSQIISSFPNTMKMVFG
jgi:glutathione S-transferase